jgi:ketosteroid isomerase-like protein
VPARADAAELEVVIEASHRALDAFFNGDAGPMKRLLSHRDDVSLANPFGPPRRGWNEVEKAMDLAAAHYRDGRAIGFDLVSKHVTPELGYAVELEHYEVKVGGNDELTAVSLRCTTVFRRESGEWRIVHRHADPITSARPAESVVAG